MSAVHVMEQGAKPGTTPETCATCGGKGQVVTTQKSLFGMVQNVTTCPHCHGSGKVIKDKLENAMEPIYIKPQKIQVSIPKRIDHGQSVRIRGKERAWNQWVVQRDLLVEVFVERNADFERRDYDIFLLLRYLILRRCWRRDRSKTIDGEVAVLSKAGTQNGTRVRLRTQEVPFSQKQKSFEENHYVDIVVDVPNGKQGAEEAFTAAEDSFNEKRWESIRDVEYVDEINMVVCKPCICYEDQQIRGFLYLSRR